MSWIYFETKNTATRIQIAMRRLDMNNRLWCCVEKIIQNALSMHVLSTALMCPGLHGSSYNNMEFDRITNR